ncbi:MAG TPA: FtsX-like permease family protein [Pseudomonadales bacterium]|nr:FtsX-like permease family protein [Pseudomonadales bacterium]
MTSAGGGTFAVAWRNLGRNRRRSLLTASAIGFASMLLVFVMNMQGGSYRIMIDNASRLLTGHVQIQDRRFHDDARIRYYVHDAGARMAALRAEPDVRVVTARAESFAVLSGPERSFGGQVMGVEAAGETAFSLLPEFVAAGRYLSGEAGEIVVGSALARNLDVGLGDEVVILGTAPDGSIAAVASTVVGLLHTSQPEVDRTLAQIPLADFREAFLLDDGAHALVILLDDVRAAPGRAPALLRVATGAAATPANGDAGEAPLIALDWRELLPDLVQLIELDRFTGWFFFLLLALMVTFSIANTFMMMIFERTHEFGTLLAIGARPGFIIGLLQLESLMLCGLGVLGGTLAGVALTLVVGSIGIPIDDMGAELLRQYHLPDRIRPRMTPEAIWSGPLFMLLATQIAALLPALRLLRMEPVVAMREA